MQEYLTIGVTKKPFGVKGELKVNIEDAFLEDFLQAKILFIAVKGKPLPFFVENIRLAGSTFLKLEDVNHKEAASQISGSELLLRKEDALADEERVLEVEETLVFKIYLGYSIEDLTLGKIGSIKDVVEFPQQEMALVTFQGKEIFIPLHHDLIESINKKTKTIQMNLPEGLVNL